MVTWRSQAALGTFDRRFWEFRASQPGRGVIAMLGGAAEREVAAREFTEHEEQVAAARTRSFDGALYKSSKKLDGEGARPERVPSAGMGGRHAVLKGAGRCAPWGHRTESARSA